MLESLGDHSSSVWYKKGAGNTRFSPPGRFFFLMFDFIFVFCEFWFLYLLFQAVCERIICNFLGATISVERKQLLVYINYMHYFSLFLALHLSPVAVQHTGWAQLSFCCQGDCWPVGKNRIFKILLSVWWHHAPPVENRAVRFEAAVIPQCSQKQVCFKLHFCREGVFMPFM